MVGWSLLACWLLLLGAAYFGVDRSASMSDLERGVASGEVKVVHVSGGLPANATGYGGVVLKWRAHLHTYRVDLLEASPLRAAPQDIELPVVRPGVVERIRTTHPALRVVRDGWATSFSDEGTVFRTRVPGWAIWLALPVVVWTFLLLVTGPQPWRATRWAWFWIFGIASPLGMLAYLVWGGPTVAWSAPRTGANRLTGGWAFLLSLLLSGISVAAVLS